MIGTDQIDELVAVVRRDYADRLPTPARGESSQERALREEKTRHVLEAVVLPELAQLRRRRREEPLRIDDENELIERVVSELFGVPSLLGTLRDPTVTDVLVFGADPVRVEHVDGTIELRKPLVRSDRDLERIIYEIAASRRRPFTHAAPFVDLELEPGVRLHGEGFDVVDRPFIAVRRAAAFGLDLPALYDRGVFDLGALDLFQAAIAAGLNVVVCGEMGAGKTTLLRALASAIAPDDVIVTVETDFELNLREMGRHRFVHAYQARIASTTDQRGIDCEAMLVPAVRTRADWIVVGEVRGGEGLALVSAMTIGQGALSTVHGGSAQDGLERLANLMMAHNGVDLHPARWQVYRSVDLVVHVRGNNSEGRWVSEIVAPGVEEDGARFVLHRLYAPDPAAPDLRARPKAAPQQAMLDRLVRATPTFDLSAWTGNTDTYKPLGGCR